MKEASDDVIWDKKKGECKYPDVKLAWPIADEEGPVVAKESARLVPVEFLVQMSRSEGKFKSNGYYCRRSLQFT